MLKNKYIFILPIIILGSAACALFLFTKNKEENKAVKIPFVFEEMSAPAFKDNICDITSYGAINDGTTLNTEAFKKAIDDCANKGGGTVFVGAGIWLTGAIHLQSNINLNLQDDAKIIFSKNPDDYLPAVLTRFEGIELFNYSPFIYANNVENVAITGNGTLDGQGESWMPWKKQESAAVQKIYEMAKENIPTEKRIFATPQDALRPSFVQFVNSRNIWLENFSITNSPMWTIHPIYSDNININNIKINTHGHNTDGIVIDSSRNVLIENSNLITGDDSISIKSGLDADGWRVAKPSENIVIRNSTISDGHSGIAIGSEMSGDVRNVIMHDIAIDNIDQGIRIKSINGRGGIVENIYAKNITIGKATNAAFQVDLNYDSATLVSTGEKSPTLRNFFIDNLKANDTNYAVSLEGLDSSILSEMHFSNVKATSKKGIRVKFGKNIDFRKISITGIKKPPIFTISDSENIKY